jgi:hypothetical protein
MSGDAHWLPDPAFVVERELLGRKRIEFTIHAAERMKERRVTAEQVVEALASTDVEGLPVDQEGGPGSPERFRIRKLLGNDSALDVVYELWPEAVVVVSTYQRKRRLGGRF